MNERLQMATKIRPTKLESLRDEYDDLAEEYQDCGDHEERCRCARRMDAIIKEMTGEGPVQP
jgi:hypothetical protein